MSIHFVREMEHLHRDILSMCSTVEEMIHNAVDGLKLGRSELGQELSGRDREVDEWDVRIEEECLKILALYHPVANDLRRVAVVMKITAQLERVADLSVHIAERACSLVNQPGIEVPQKLTEMANRAVEMLHQSIDAYVGLDSQVARLVTESDHVVDELNREIIIELMEVMERTPQLIEPALSLFSASRHIERVADHATNIAEDVVYLVEGEIIRHRAHFR